MNRSIIFLVNLFEIILLRNTSPFLGNGDCYNVMVISITKSWGTQGSVGWASDSTNWGWGNDLMAHDFMRPWVWTPHQAHCCSFH